MKIAHIYPIANMQQMRGQEYNMLLTHLAQKYPAYKEMCKLLRQEGSYTILDNSLIECDKALSIEEVCDIAEEIEACEIIIPDVFLDGPATIESFEKSIEYLHKRYGNDIPFNLMAVAQGKDVQEFKECYSYFLYNDNVDCIGIPKVCAKLHPQGRPYFEHFWLDRGVHKPLHLLGVWYSLEELKRYARPSVIRSVDTCHMSFLQKNNLSLYSVRPDGFTLDLEKDVITGKRPKGMRRLEWSIR